MELVEPSSDAGHPIQMDFNQVQNRKCLEISAAPTTAVQLPTDGVAPEPNIQSCTVVRSDIDRET